MTDPVDTVSTVSALFARSTSTLHLDETSVSAAELAGDGARLAAGLAGLGLAPGDRLAVWCTNGLPYLRCLTAAAAGGHVLVSVNTRFSDEEGWSIIRRSGARMLVTDRTIHEAHPGVVVLPSSELSDLVVGADADAPEADVRAEPDQPFAVFTTSGTTSQPKLVLHTQRSIAVHASQVVGPFGYGTSSRILMALPLCGVFGLCSLTSAVAAGADVWMPSGFDGEQVSALVEQYRITAMNGPDDMIHRMLLTGRDLSSIEMAGYGRFNSSLHDVVERAEAAGMILTGLYGMSEVQALFAVQDPSRPAGRRAPGGGAVVSPEAAARVVDPDSGVVSGPGTEGELQLRGPSLFAGYLADGGAAIDVTLTDGAHVVDAQGRRWFRTGDLARIETDGRFTFLTRMGDVLRLGGFLVSPAEIEDVLIGIDGIAEAQVVAVARPEGVRPVAMVIADASADHPLDEDKVKATCATHVAKFKVPIRVVELEEFPVTRSANGTKIRRSELQRLAEQAILD